MKIDGFDLIVHFYTRGASLLGFRLFFVLTTAVALLYLERLHTTRCNESIQSCVNNLRQRFHRWQVHHADMTTKLIYKGKNAFFYDFDMTECIVKNCFVTEDVERVAESDAVLINWFHQPRKVMREMRRRRKADQRWVFTTMEAPPHEVLMVGYGRTWTYFKKLNGIFNWTMTYRQDSDIPRRYGRFTLRKRPLESMPFTVGTLPKEKPAVWLVSNCHSSSKRADYVRELQKYIDIDIVGSCGTPLPHCDRSGASSQTTCHGYLASRYDFYLAFENSICKDYITEKVFEMLRYDIVAVVMGGGNYSAFVPPKSFVDVADFGSPRALATFLMTLRGNRMRYWKYFEWRKMYSFQHAPGENELCELCRKLNDRTEPEKTYVHFAKWWVDDANCRTWMSFA